MENNDPIIGKIFKNIRGLEYVAISDAGINDSGHRMYVVEFLKTKNRVIASKSEITHNCVRDYYSPSTCGVGYIGDIKVAAPKEHHREHVLWRNMLSRCYNENNRKDYMSYGGIGVTVCKRWHCFQNFLEDIKDIDGYDEKKFFAGKLTLDKDLKQIDKPHSERVYSKETCTFISNEENMKMRDTYKYSKKFFAVSPEGETIEVVGIVKFCRKYKLNERCVNDRLSGRLKSLYCGWSFHY